MQNKEEQKQHLINMMQGDEELGLYESWVKDSEKESDLSDLNDRANAFWLGYRTGIKAKERMYSEEDLKEAFRQGQDNMDYSEISGWDSKLTEQKWFEQFKKK